MDPITLAGLLATASIVGTNTAIPNSWLSYWDLITERRAVHFTDGNHADMHYTDRSPSPQLSIASEKNGHLAETLDLLAAIEADGETRCPISEGAETLRHTEPAQAALRRQVLPPPEHKPTDAKLNKFRIHERPKTEPGQIAAFR